MYDQPPGYIDMLADADRIPPSPNFHRLVVPDVCTVLARKPMPGAAAALGMAANSKISGHEKQNHLVLFVISHIGEEEYGRVLYGMTVSDLPKDSVQKIARAIATWGTARPTSPLSRSAR